MFFSVSLSLRCHKLPLHPQDADGGRSQPRRRVTGYPTLCSPLGMGLFLSLQGLTRQEAGSWAGELTPPGLAFWAQGSRWEQVLQLKSNHFVSDNWSRRSCDSPVLLVRVSRAQPTKAGVGFPDVRDESARALLALSAHFLRAPHGTDGWCSV